ncbi:S41 family peptidase [Helicobacter mustelae]|uniref:Putative secreted protease n=1 Tax=Helicobacter mustelae (strain ATCC 43772 / CCUG 25715 / CIP 103759 / LMG 18044 / NCTC 12198 / R85-136P) TaxID=679897 RepID=D3UI71_HELM1|nr:putative secreted protease [Helicobacter mustelae 12198]SQH71696.1 secreted protease [Helicobacter mustelae]STP12822.1 secreted protease [Helicobacter mustelae]
MSKYFLSGFLTTGFVSLALLFQNIHAETLPHKKSTQQERIDAFNKLTKVINTVEKVYVDDVDISQIVDKAISGLLTNLDAHSDYLTAKKFKELQAQTEGEFGGLGITVGMKDGALTVISPLDDSPAQKAGLKSGDIILKINNESTLNMSIDDAVNLMRGKPKTSINLTIYRKGAPKPLEFKITRDIVQIKSVHARKIEGEKFLYIRVNNFDKNVTSSVKAALEKAGKIDGLILDLRNNPGGLLNQAVGLSELFIKDGVIVSQKGRVKNENVEYKANGKAPYEKLPIVVLINGGTASASEIVSGALQDYKRALIVGEKSFGKGSVQVVLPVVDNDSAIKLTTAKYYLPSGRTIQAIGITPDILVYAGKVPQNEGGFEIKEADLKNHLRNELIKLNEEKTEATTEEKFDKKGRNKGDRAKNDKIGNKSKKEENKKNIITESDINNDIQLKTAIDLLKTWNIIKSPVKSPLELKKITEAQNDSEKKTEAITEEKSDKKHR